MKNIKKTKHPATSAGLKLQSDNAIMAFKKLVSGLKAANDEADVAKSENAKQIELLEQENAAIDLVAARNSKIVQNVERLLEIG